MARGQGKPERPAAPCRCALTPHGVPFHPGAFQNWLHLHKLPVHHCKTLTGRRFIFLSSPKAQYSARLGSTHTIVVIGILRAWVEEPNRPGVSPGLLPTYQDVRQLTAWAQ